MALGLERDRELVHEREARERESEPRGFVDSDTKNDAVLSHPFDLVPRAV